MNMTPQELVTRFIETRDAIRAAFRLENEYIYPVCAQIFLAADRPVEAERLDRCKALVKSSTGPFSIPSASMFAQRTVSGPAATAV